MRFKILDPNVSTTMNGFIIVANIINLIYNIPQMIKTYKTKSTRDFSATFIVLRIVGNLIWVGYSVEIDSFLMLINNLVTVIASIFIGYYKTKEMYYDYYKNKSYVVSTLDEKDNVILLNTVDVDEKDNAVL